MAANSLQDLYTMKLQMMYDAERQGLDFLPRLVQMARNDDLRTGLEAHRRQSEEHVRRLERMFQDRGQQPQPQECVSMRALIQESERTMRNVQDPDAMDALIIAADQAVEHHEIADYGTARTWARQAGREGEADILDRILQEEKGTDQLLSDIAERIVNPEAARKRGAAAERDVTAAAQAGDTARRAPTGGAGGGAGGART
ncbi:MAG: ferritin-like domain-containing protein, partial [Gemmatimonadaceae bacterium]